MTRQYITEINRFYEFVRINGPTASEIALFLGLLQINNRCMWTEWFTAAVSELELISGVKADNLYKVRNRLKQWGLIDIRIQGGRKASKYKICSYNTPNFPSEVQTGCRQGTNEVRTGCGQSTTLTDKEKDKDISSLSFDARAKEIYQSYEENIGILTGMVAEELDGYTELLFPEAVIYAIRQAAINNKKSCSYVKAVCKGLLNAEVKTPLDLEKYVKEREEYKHKVNAVPMKNNADRKQYMQSGKSYSDRDLFPDLFE